MTAVVLLIYTSFLVARIVAVSLLETLYIRAFRELYRLKLRKIEKTN